MFAPVSVVASVANSFDPYHQYYPSPMENPIVVLVPVLLNGSNYYSWARSIRLTLLSKNKLVFVDGSKPAIQFVSLSRQFHLTIC
ncbi:hypothetical protein LINPERHAP1_LOCUS36216 [Linum perenne]